MEKIDLALGETKSLVDYVDAKRATVSIEGSLRVAIDGTAPDTDRGHLVSDGSLILVDRGEIKNFKAYAVTAGKIQVSYIQ